MANCPKCGKELTEPERSLRNCVFQIDAYVCEACRHQFKETKELLSI